MKKLILLTAAAFLFTGCATELKKAPAAFNVPVFPENWTMEQDSWPAPEEINALARKVADWQIRTFRQQGKYRALASVGWNPGKKNHADLGWENGALYAGMMEWVKATGDQKVKDFMINIGEKNDWQLWRRPYHADDHTVGQIFLTLYEEYKKPEMMRPTQERFDWILDNPKTGSLMWGNDTDCHDRWGWCDALFMAPPVWARLARITGDQRYLDFMDQEYHATYDLLWNEKDRFFWRDSSYFTQFEANGENIYWSRGNGWVFGGLALMLPDLPEDWEGRPFYVNLFQEMAESLIECQRADGTWNMGLLGGKEAYPAVETSGTSFFAYGLAWGILNGYLDREKYEPAIYKAWSTLSLCVNEDGMLTFVQPIGAAPGDSYPDKTEVYGVGAFLAAASQIIQLAESAR